MGFLRRKGINWRSRKRMEIETAMGISWRFLKHLEKVRHFPRQMDCRRRRGIKMQNRWRWDFLRLTGWPKMTD